MGSGSNETPGWSQDKSGRLVLCAMVVNNAGGTNYTLTTVVNPSGAGTIDLNPSGGSYASGTHVTASYRVNPGYSFTSWSGAGSGTGTSTTITMDANKSVTANFSSVSNPQDLDVSGRLTVGSLYTGPGYALDVIGSAYVYGNLNSSGNALIGDTRSYLSVNADNAILYYDGSSIKIDRINSERVVEVEADKVTLGTAPIECGAIQFPDGTVQTTAAKKQPKGSCVDIDGNVYQTIVIGNQEWTVTNLKTTTLNDGTAIPNVTSDAAWEALTTLGYCWYNNDKSANEKYGALYNWYTVNTGKLAPTGWRVPTDADWTVLENYLIANGYNWDGTTTGNTIAKSMAAGIWQASPWQDSATPGEIGNDLSLNNRSGFSGLPGGYRFLYGDFQFQSNNGYWWSATDQHDEEGAACRGLAYDQYHLIPLIPPFSPKRCGFSVRLLRDLN